MKLRCLEANEGDSYALLDSTNKDSATEKQEELTFWNPDGTYQKVVVERNLRTVDLCQILATKNRVSKDLCWSIVENWPKPNVERFYEDHEDILAVHRRVKTSEKRYIFLCTPEKYDGFSIPECLFPSDMLAYMKSICPTLDLSELLQNILWNYQETPVIFSQGFEQCSDNRLLWIKKFFVLKGTRIYSSADPAVVKRFVLSFRNLFCKGGFGIKPEMEITEKSLLEGTAGFMRTLILGRGEESENSSTAAVAAGSVSNNVIRSNHLRLEGNESTTPESTTTATLREEDEKSERSGGACSLESESPGAGGQVIRKTGGSGSLSGGTAASVRRTDLESSVFLQGLDLSGLEFFADLKDWEVYLSESSGQELGCPAALVLRSSTEEDLRGALYLGTSSKGDSRCWQAAMRLAKYGKQLKENFITYKGKLQPGKPDHLIQDDLRSRVAMDFTGKQGRIVEDPQEAKEIERFEGVIWKKRWAEGAASHQYRRQANVAREDLPANDEGPHMGQPWYHGTMSREQAVSLLNSLGDKDGVFVVRDSKSKPGCYVLTSKHNGKIIHSTIEPVQPREEGLPLIVYSLDSGATRFLDLQQLIWFYILNRSNLPSKLLHWSKH